MKRLAGLEKAISDDDVMEKQPFDGVLFGEADVSGERPTKKGSFGGHLEELVKHFPQGAPSSAKPKAVDRRALQEKLDIHAMLFERAWQMERDGDPD